MQVTRAYKYKSMGIQPWNCNIEPTKTDSARTLYYLRSKRHDQFENH